MPRSSSSSSSRSSRPSAVSRPSSSPSRITSPTPYTPSGVSSVPSFGQTIKEGIGLGIGSSLGSRLVNSIFGPPTIQVASPTPVAPPASPLSPDFPSPCPNYAELKRAMDICLFTTMDGADCSRAIEDYKECIHSK